MSIRRAIVYKSDAQAQMSKRKWSKMKELLAVIPLLLSGVVAEAPAAPYPPSGFRPSGPAFELPQKTAQSSPQQEYLPPSVDPRIPSTSYGVPEEDVSVQGLPTLEQRPVFQASPISGQQYVGPDFNTDIKSLDESYRQNQYQIQQEQYRQYERQRQLEAAQARSRANQVPTPQSPRQFATETTHTAFTTEATTTEATTESDLNEGETVEEDKKEKVKVEVTKQNIQEYPGELFLSSLAQLQLQPQFVPFGQIRAPLYFQPLQQESQKQVASSGFDAATHFAALPSVLAQQQYLQGVQAQGFVNPAFQQQVVVSGQDPNVGFVNPQYQPTVQANPQLFNGQYQPAQQTFPQAVVQPQYAQPNPQQGFPQGVVQPQYAQINPQAVAVQQQGQQNPQTKSEDEEDQQNDQEQPQFVYQQSYQPQEVIYQPAPQAQYQPQQQGFQPQPQSFQPQPQGFQPQPQGFQPQPQGFQPQPQVFYQGAPQQAPANQYQPQEQQSVYVQPEGQYQPQAFLPQAQLVNYQTPLIQQYQSEAAQFQNGLAPQQQFPQPQVQQINQEQDALQSGLDANQQGNGVEENDEEDADDSYQNQAPTSVAVATAFGARTQPRVITRYGAPAPVPRDAASPQTTTEAAVNEDSEAVAVAEANASSRRKNAKLRSRRVRPVFTLDRSGHLVLAQQN